MHFTSNILMISPEKFRANEFTVDDNVFQSREVVDSEVSIQAIEEFEKLKNAISDGGVSVYSINGDSSLDTPDAVFPNNWISFHYKNNVFVVFVFRVVVPFVLDLSKLRQKQADQSLIEN